MLKRKEMEHCDKIGFPPLHQPFILQLVFSSTQKVILEGNVADAVVVDVPTRDGTFSLGYM